MTPTTTSATRQPSAGLTSKDVEVTYTQRDGRGLSAVRALSVQINPHEFVSIVGPSGCGKSTFLKTVGGLITPSSGSILLDNEPIEVHSGIRSIVFQEASLFPWYSVARNVAYGLICRGEKPRAAKLRVRPLIETVGLGGFDDSYPHELSGGMQQRVNLARALAVDPEVLLMDEPFASLDAQTREIMQVELLRIWQASEKMVLFVTHQIDEAIFLSDRVLVMSARPGRILADIPIDVPRPRSLSMKQGEVFVSIERRIWSLLEDEVRKTMMTGSRNQSPVPSTRVQG